MTSETPRFVEGAQALVESYDLFLLDQYGVLHDGLAAYPGAVEALRELRARGRRLCPGISLRHGRIDVRAAGQRRGVACRKHVQSFVQSRGTVGPPHGPSCCPYLLA